VPKRKQAGGAWGKARETLHLPSRRDGVEVEWAAEGQGQGQGQGGGEGEGVEAEAEAEVEWVAPSPPPRHLFWTWLEDTHKSLGRGGDGFLVSSAASSQARLYIFTRTHTNTHTHTHTHTHITCLRRADYAGGRLALDTNEHSTAAAGSVCAVWLYAVCTVAPS
jgi:hypothetical protein